MKSQYKGIKRIIFAFKNSYDGFLSAFKSEVAFRQDLFICGILFILVWFLRLLIVERVLLISSLFFVLFAELVNSAVEATIDRISDDWHILSKKAKDIGSLLVFISFINLLFTWFFICKKFF